MVGRACSRSGERHVRLPVTEVRARGCSIGGSDMDFALLPPEVNSARMYAGAGSGPMLAAASAWDGLAAELHSAAESYQSAITSLTAGPWLGPSSATMA